MKTQKIVNNAIFEIKEYKNKYRLAAEEIYASLGAGNYENVYHCVTRFRSHIIDKKSVNIDAIKKIQLVKGINWAGDELQIIIGGEVYKVLDEFKVFEKEILNPVSKNNKENVVKKTWGAKILGFLNGVMAPCVPIFMIVAMTSAIYALLTLPGNELIHTSIANPNGGDDITIDMGTLYLFDIWSALMFVLSKVVISLLGIFFIYNTTKYFNGNPLLALAVGFTLVSRGFFPASLGSSLDDANFGNWISDSATGKNGFFLFQIGNYPIVVGGYEAGVIPFIVAGVLVTYLDKWVKKWMPSTVDIVFRPTFVYVVAMFALWFLLAPISGLVEYGLVIAITWLAKIPYGFGVGLYALFWQPLILVGAGTPAAMPVTIGIIGGTPSALQIAMEVGAFTQVGAVIGLIILTKNSNARKVMIATLPGGLFGVTEPIIYAITLPKVKPFLLGCLNAFLSGILLGILNIEAVRLGGYGILSILVVDQTVNNILLLILVYAVSVVGSIILVVLFHSERKNESNYFKKGVNKLIHLVYPKEKEKQLELKKSFEPFRNELKLMKNDYKKINNYYSEISKCEQELIRLENKESNERRKMYKKLVNLKAKLTKKEDSKLINQFNELNTKYSNYNLDSEKEKVQLKMKKIDLKYKTLFDEFNKKKELIHNKSINEINNFETSDNKVQILSIKNIIWNALNSVEVGFGIEDAKPIKFKKKGVS